MSKRSAITLGLAILLGIMTSAISAAIAPSILQVTGPILCPQGSTFRVQEGSTVVLPDDRQVAPVHFACVAPGRSEVAPNLAASVFVLFLAHAAAWWALLARLANRLATAAKTTGGANRGA